MRISTRATLSLAMAGALVAACGGAAAPQAPAADLAAAPAATPVPSPKEITPLPASPTPMPTTDGQGDEVVRGVMTSGGLIKNYTITRVGDVDQYRGGVVSLTDKMNDPRVDGTVTFEFSVDLYGVAASEWGTMKVENADGAWEGPCTGGVWSDGNGIAWSCWLTGSGDYDGYTYYKQTQMDPTDPHAKVVGVVYPGEPPKGR